MTQATDHELLARTHRGDSAAAREFWSRFAPSMLAYARALLRRHGGEPAAADAVQTVFCRLLELDRRAITAVADVPAFLTRSTRHAALNLIRSTERSAARDAAHGRAPGSVSPPGAVLDALSALDHLNDDDRELVVLKHAAGLTFDQIALSLDLNRSTVAARYRRIVETLRAPAPARAVGGHILRPEANHV